MKKCWIILAGSLMGGMAHGENLTHYIWSGAPTVHSIKVNARTVVASKQVRLVVSTSEDLSNPLYSDYAASVADENFMARMTLSGLTEKTPYHYAVEVGGVLDDRRGQFRTMPSGAASMRFIFGACAGKSTEKGTAKGASNHPVFDHMRQESPLFYLNMGDLFYADIKENNSDLFRNAFNGLHAASRQRALYEATPLIYMWDDHDFGPNDSDRTSPSREAARLTYQEIVPHFPLVAGRGDVPIYQTFSAGRVKFILTDQRSEKSAKADPDNSSKTVLGAEQKKWLKAQLLEGKKKYAMTVWVSSFPWIAAAEEGEDNWAGYSTEREELALFIKKNGITNLVMLSGDAHMLAADDGTNNDFAPGGGTGFPVFQAAAIHRKGSEKGGPYSEGMFKNPDQTHGQYGVFEITDTGGDTLNYTFTGKRVKESGEVSTLIRYSGSVKRSTP